MGKDAPSAPAAPDPYATARAQTSSNVSTSIANAVMGNAWETSPLGSVRYQQRGSYQLKEPILDSSGNPTRTSTWVPDPVDPNAPVNNTSYYSGTGSDGYGASAVQPTAAQSPSGHYTYEDAYTTRDLPIWERIVELSPQQQALFDKQQGVQSQLMDLASSQSKRLTDTLAQPLSLDGLPELPTAANLNDLRSRYEDALMQRLNPQLAQDRAALETQLANQGLTRGGEAFNRSMDEYTRQANDARLGVIAQGGQEQANALSQALALRERGLQERMALRNAPINEISALLGQSQVSMPQFSPFQGSPMQATPVGDYVYKSADINSRNWQAEAQADAQSNAGMFSLGSSLLGGLFKLSDRSTKRDIKVVGALPNGLAIYTYRHNWSDTVEIGLMADEVEAFRPGAVANIGGLRHVNYELATAA